MSKQRRVLQRKASAKCDPPEDVSNEKQLEMLVNLERKFPWKKNDPLEANLISLKRKAFPSDACPLLKDFSVVEYIGRGVDGVALLVERKHENKTEQYVVKFMPVDYGYDNDDPTYTEIRINYILSKMIKQPYQLEDYICNFVKTYDWALCDLKLSEYLKGHLPKSKREDHPTDFETIPYQIMLMEYANYGTAYSLAIENPQVFFTRSFLLGFIAQVCLTGDNLAHEIGFTHGDAHLSNLLARMPVECSDKEFIKEKYLHYPYHLNSTEYSLYIPLEYTAGLIFKFSDYGFSQVFIKDKNKPVFRANASVMKTSMSVEGVKLGNTNLSFDLHKFGCHLLIVALDQFRQSRIDFFAFKDALQLIVPLINGFWHTDQPHEMYSKILRLYQAVETGKFVEYDEMGEPIEEEETEEEEEETDPEMTYDDLNIFYDMDGMLTPSADNGYFDLAAFSNTIPSTIGPAAEYHVFGLSISFDRRSTHEAGLYLARIAKLLENQEDVNSLQELSVRPDTDPKNIWDMRLKLSIDPSIRRFAPPSVL